MIKNIINYALLTILLLAALVFSLENDSLIFVSLFPFDAGIELPLWTYTIALLFAGALLGIAAAKAFARRKIQK